ncbi:hypothetical protein [Cryobacterium gelidum]|uniref:Preprotein translocase subunit SecD n=1 Tax=Cryobacterium gelidum TaxID=1259164 RepID=A0A4R9AYU1_9MICO|nr:hypothetical protein [Cryobacterium gelidum]TFD72910.1 hypothetical protein E3T50_04175 [Cryobacterium gelidum]
MTSRTPRLSVVILAALALSACSATADEVSSGTGGTIELAISETCAEGSDSQCVSVNGENVLLPSAFERAGVEESSVAGDGQNAVDVTFNADGAEILHALTEKAARAGDSARLVISIGGELQAAVVVMEALEGDQVQIALSPDDNVQEIVDLIQGG